MAELPQSFKRKDRKRSSSSSQDDCCSPKDKKTRLEQVEEDSELDEMAETELNNALKRLENMERSSKSLTILIVKGMVSFKTTTSDKTVETILIDVQFSP